MIGDGPHSTDASMLAYLRDEQMDPVTQQWLDQLMAATDNMRAKVGIDVDPELRIPSERKSQALASMWQRLIADSDDGRCEHIVDRALQPTIIDPVAHRQLCEECCKGHEWDALPDDLTIAEAREIACDCCQHRFTRRWDDHDTGDEGIWTEMRQWWNYVAPLRLCSACYRLLNYYDEDLPPEIREGVAAVLAQKCKNNSQE